MNQKPLKVLYLFAGERKSLEEKWRQGLTPDSQLIGLNHLKDFGIDASYIENRFLNFIRRKNFNLTNLLLLPVIRRYDVVFSGASLFLPFVAKVLLRMKRPKFVWYNTFFTNTLKRNVDKKFRSWILRKTIDSLDAIICPSTAQRRFLIDTGFDQSKIFFVPNGIDIEFMKRRTTEGGSSSKSAERFVLSVGKDMGRDYETLIRAVKDIPIEVRIVALPRNVEAVGEIPANVKILGFVPFPRLVELYKEALFVVIPTKGERHLDASDCSGQYVLLDAMSIDKAIIASERETLADYFTDGEEGVTTTAENSDELRKAINEMLHDEVKRKEFGQKASKRGATFTTSRMAENLAVIFKGVVKK